MWPFKINKSAMKPEAPLKPGTCECDHERCSHEKGTGRCHVEYPPDKEWPLGAGCACQIFILDKDDGEDPVPEAPTPSQLERMYNR